MYQMRLVFINSQADIDLHNVLRGACKPNVSSCEVKGTQKSRLNYFTYLWFVLEENMFDRL